MQKFVYKNGWHTFQGSPQLSLFVLVEHPFCDLRVLSLTPTVEITRYIATLKFLGCLSKLETYLVHRVKYNT